MTQKNQPGYPLPSGVLGDDEIVCQLVYLPDRPEYWQALLAAIHYFSTWRAWERDTDKRGKDAASNWRDAFELTIGCWRMACLDQLQEDVANILLTLQSKKDCCDDNITYVPGPDVETDIEPDVGDPPDFYGETAVADWDDWREHVCFNAHRYVDQLIHMAEELEHAADNSLLSIGVVAAALALLSFTGIGLPVAFALASATFLLLAAAGTLIFDGAPADLEAARMDIVCALIKGTSLRDAVETALGDTSPEWLYMFKWNDYEAATAIIYEGGFDGEFLPADTSEDCELCDYDLLEPEDYYQQIATGDQHDYDEDTKIHSLRLNSAYGCMYTDLYYWTDGTMTTRLNVRIEILTCTGTGTCAATAFHRGFTEPGTVLIWSKQHSPMAEPADGEINRWVSTHTLGGVVTYRIYEA